MRSGHAIRLALAARVLRRAITDVLQRRSSIPEQAFGRLVGGEQAFDAQLVGSHVLCGSEGCDYREKRNSNAIFVEFQRQNGKERRIFACPQSVGILVRLEIAENLLHFQASESLGLALRATPKYKGRPPSNS